MPYAADSDFTLRIAGAITLPLALRTAALSDARAFIDEVQFGDRALRAHVELAAHFLAFMPGGSVVGGPVVSSMSAGEISASFAIAPPSSVMDFSSTPHGREFLAIANGLVAPPTAV